MPYIPATLIQRFYCITYVVQYYSDSRNDIDVPCPRLADDTERQFIAMADTDSLPDLLYFAQYVVLTFLISEEFVTRAYHRQNGIIRVHNRSEQTPDVCLMDVAFLCIYEDCAQTTVDTPPFAFL